MKYRSLLCVLIVFAMVAAIQVQAAEVGSPEETVQTSSISWSFDEATGTLTVTGTGAMPDYDTESGAPWAMHSGSITSVAIGEGVTSVGSYAFCGFYENIVSVSLPSTLKRIGEQAFARCRSITSIALPAGLEEIGAYAFTICTEMPNVTIPGSVKEIGEFAFSLCSSLTEVNISHGTQVIGRGAFAECSNLSKISLSNTVTEIGQIAFAATALTDVTLPASVSSIGTNAFGGCSGLVNVTILNELCAMEEYILGEGLLGASISGFAGSTAQSHARDYGYQFKELDRCQVFGHVYSHSGVAATCTEQGYTEHICNVCGDTYRDSIVDALGHEFTEWVQTKAPTETQTGLMERKCSRCGEKEQQVLPKLKADPAETETTAPADCTEPETRAPADPTEPETQPETTAPQETLPEQTQPGTSEKSGNGNAVGIAAAVIAVVAAAGAGGVWFFLKKRKM